MPKAKILTREEKLKKAYTDLYNLNQKLKNISSLYYIGEDGNVYLKSLVPFLESFVKLRYPEKYTFFQRGIIPPNQFFNFGKKLKKTKLIIREIDDEEGKRFGFVEEDTGNAFSLNLLSLDIETIKQKLGYKRIFELENSEKYETFESNSYSLTSEQIESLINGNYVEVKLLSGDLLALTKHLFLDIKKGDTIQISKIARQMIDEGKNECRLFFLITRDTDLYTSYTIFNKISS